MKEKIIKKFEHMKGKTWMYNGHHYKFNDIAVTDNFMVIGTDGKQIMRPLKKAMEFFKECHPVDDKPVVKKENIKLAVYNKSITDELHEALLDNIRKVKSDPEYIKQANSVSQSVNAYLKMVKTEIEVRKILNKYGGNDD